MTEENGVVKQGTPQEGQITSDVGGDSKTPDNASIVSMSQTALDKIMADRAAQAKRSLLSEIGIEDVTVLKSIIEAQKQADEAKIAATEAAKSELQKKQEMLDASVALQVKQADTIKRLQIESAIKDIAPSKEIPANHFAALLKLMDTTGITIADGVVDIDSVGKVLDTTLESNPFLKAPEGKQNGFGSPVRANKPQIRNIEQPAKPTKKYSI